jgi:hypothetical protein
MRRLNPLSGAGRGNVDTRPRLAHSPTAEQNQKKRTSDVLPKPDNLTRYRQAYEAGLHLSSRENRLLQLDFSDLGEASSLSEGFGSDFG